jgi:hypothetical protein
MFRANQIYFLMGGETSQYSGGVEQAEPQIEWRGPQSVGFRIAGSKPRGLKPAPLDYEARLFSRELLDDGQRFRHMLIGGNAVVL